MLGQGNHFVAGGFDGSRFVYVDMGGFCGQNSFVVSQKPVDDGCVGLCTSYQEMYGCFRLSACLADQFLCTGGIGIISISYGLFQIGFGQAPYHFRMGTFHIVCVKMYHVVFLCLISLAKVTKKNRKPAGVCRLE